MLMALEPFVTAEVDYRLAQARQRYTRLPGRRHRVRRRPSLHLPHSRRRPLALA